MTDAPPPPAPGPDADLLAIVEATLDRRPVPPEVQARHATPARVAARADRDARARSEDWPALARYRTANAAARNPTLVMIGDSLTEIWRIAVPQAFGARVVNRGIAGQTSGQILLRFMADVVDLAPVRVHILCGTNDIAGNTGANTPDDYQRNIRAMLDLARAAKIGVLLGAIPPAATIPWNADARPRTWVPRLNAWLRAIAAERGACFIDYAALLDDGTGALQPRFSADGVHVTREAYRAMQALLDQVSASWNG